MPLFEHFDNSVRNERLQCCSGRSPVFDELVEVLFHVLEHEIKRIVLSNHFFELDEIRMAELL